MFSRSPGGGRLKPQPLPSPFFEGVGNKYLRTGRVNMTHVVLYYSCLENEKNGENRENEENEEKEENEENPMLWFINIITVNRGGGGGGGGCSLITSFVFDGISGLS